MDAGQTSSLPVGRVGPEQLAGPLQRLADVRGERRQKPRANTIGPSGI